MTKASGRKAHNNGAQFEKHLKDVVLKAMAFLSKKYGAPHTSK